jgi:phosphoribosyl 1,2-cyclic phosphodiesterase
VAEFRNGIADAANVVEHVPDLSERGAKVASPFSADGHRWVLVNASPDLRSQLIDSAWRPRSRTRGSGIEAILLTDADLDQYARPLSLARG